MWDRSTAESNADTPFSTFLRETTPDLSGMGEGRISLMPCLFVLADDRHRVLASSVMPP